MTNQTPDEHGNYGLNTVEDTLHALMNSELEDFKHFYGGIFYNDKTHLVVFHNYAAMATMNYDFGHPDIQHYTRVYIDELHNDHYCEYEKLRVLNQELLIREMANTFRNHPDCTVAIHRMSIYCCENNQEITLR